MPHWQQLNPDLLVVLRSFRQSVLFLFMNEIKCTLFWMKWRFRNLFIFWKLSDWCRFGAGSDVSKKVGLVSGAKSCSRAGLYKRRRKKCTCATAHSIRFIRHFSCFFFSSSSVLRPLLRHNEEEVGGKKMSLDPNSRQLKHFPFSLSFLFSLTDQCNNIEWDKYSWKSFPSKWTNWTLWKLLQSI